MSDFEDRVLDSVLGAALQSEALFTMLLGEPAVCRFQWHPSDELERAFGEQHARSGDAFDHWVAMLLKRRPLSALEGDMRPSSFVDAAQICELQQQFAIRARLPDVSSLFPGLTRGKGEPVTMYCLNLVQLRQYGIDIADTRLWTHMAASVLFDRPDMPAIEHDADRPYSWVLQAMKRVQASSDSSLTTRIPMLSFDGVDRQPMGACQFAPVDDDALFIVVTAPPPASSGSYLTDRNMPKAPSCFVSTPTASGEVAELGWVHRDVAEPFSAAELAVLSDRTAVALMAKWLTAQYPAGAARRLLDDWSFSADGRRALAHAVGKARRLFAQLNHATPELLQRLLREATTPSLHTDKVTFERLLSRRLHCRLPRHTTYYDDLIHNTWQQAYFDCCYRWSRNSAADDDDDERLLCGLPAVRAWRIASDHCRCLVLYRPTLAALVKHLHDASVRAEFARQMSVPLGDDDDVWPGQAYLRSIYERMAASKDDKLVDVLLELFRREQESRRRSALLANRLTDVLQLPEFRLVASVREFAIE